MNRQYDLVLSKKICDAWRDNELIDVVITGGRGWGKSVFALKVAHGFFMAQGCNYDEAWEKALGSMFYRLDDVINTLSNQLKKGERIPMIIVDDASLHFSKYLYQTKQQEVAMLKSMMDILRTCTAAFIMTCPNEEGLLKFIREYGRDRFKVEISKVNGQGGRKATGYQVYVLPSGHRRISKKFEDHYGIHIPNRYYEQYDPKRRQLAAEAIDVIKAAINTAGFNPSFETAIKNATGNK